MGSIVLLCTDGSDAAIAALSESLPLLAPADRTIVVTVESPSAPEIISGKGFSAGPGSSETSEPITTSGDTVAMQVLEQTRVALGLDDAEIMAIVGRQPGPAICDLAASLPASAVVIGTHGRGGVARAVMGSTSDHIIRHARCPVVVQGVSER